MLTFKAALYLVTIASAFFFASWEMRIKSQSTESAVQEEQRPSEMGIFNDLSKRMEREAFLKSLPREAVGRLRVVAALKFVFIAILIIEVLVLQR